MNNGLPLVVTMQQQSGSREESRIVFFKRGGNWSHEADAFVKPAA
jgi:hypothetical protein